MSHLWFAVVSIHTAACISVSPQPPQPLQLEREAAQELGQDSQEETRLWRLHFPSHFSEMRPVHYTSAKTGI